MDFSQTSFVDVSVVEITTTIRSSTTIPLLESSTALTTSTFETTSEADVSPGSPTDPPSMFSTSMAPPRPTSAGHEEELITTVAPTIKEDHEDDDSPSVIQVSTIQPDVPIPDAPLSTKPMFAEGETEETIIDSGNITAIPSDLSDTPTKSTDLSHEEMFSSSESTPSASTSMTPADYGFNYDDPGTVFAVEAVPHHSPTQADGSSSPSDATGIDDTITAVLPLNNTHPGSEETTTLTPETQTLWKTQDDEAPPTSVVSAGTPILMDSETVAEVKSSTAVHVFDESFTQVTERPAGIHMEDDAATELGTEFFTSAPLASAVTGTTAHPAAAHTDEQTIPMTTITQIQNVSGKKYVKYFGSCCF